MGKKRVLEVCMESPLYFTMPLRMRLELVKQGELVHSAQGLREDLLNWVKTGLFDSSGRERNRQ